MLNPISRALLVLTAAGAVLAGGYFVAGGDRTGVVLLGFLAGAGLVAALSTAGNAVADVAPPVEGDAPPGTTTVSHRIPAGSGWPLASAVALGVLAVGAAVGVPVLVAGLVLVLVATAGWFARAWSEHPTWTAPVRQRVSTRLLAPIGLPAGCFLLAAAIAISFSRVLLAVSEEAARALAIGAAAVVFLACAWVASRPRLGSSALVALAVLAGASTLGAGIAGAVGGERHFEEHDHEKEPVVITAKEIKFSKDTISVKAGEDVHLEFVNEDGETFHNVAVYEGDGGPDSKPVFNGEGFPGHGERTYEFRAPPPGSYTFVCDFHPNMKGELISEGES